MVAQWAFVPGAQLSLLLYSVFTLDSGCLLFSYLLFPLSALFAYEHNPFIQELLHDKNHNY